MENNVKISMKWIMLLILFVMLSKYNIYIGFSLKIYMIFLVIYFCLTIKKFHIQKLYFHEVVFLLFYFIYCLSGILSIYLNASIRMIFGVLLVLGCYFIMRNLLGNVEIAPLESSIVYVGLLFNIVSLILYIVGLQHFGLYGGEEREIFAGLLVDRGYPRLIGLLDDPNIFIFYNTVFFMYYMTNLHNMTNIIGLILCVTTSLLTFSRGGILALVLVVFVYVCTSSFAKKIKIMMSLLLFSVVIFSLSNSVMGGQLDDILNKRISDFSHDNGSGRFTLWEAAFKYYISNPYIGIGAFNFSNYYEFQFNEKLYVHNTFLEILSESGTIGFLLYSAFLIILMFKLTQYTLFREKPYLLLTMVAFLFQMMSLSLIINEAFFLFLAIVVKYISIYEGRGKIDGKMSIST
ncbi:MULTISPECIES: O-antigen ligase family protein [Bacillus cereus group]|uniref:O-antigen ligase family protein n=1 Tax=Bacillus cereus group TaxID=86661 RepID=UPI001F5A9DBF|nr:MULTISPECIES: O-antigen ligase family protein [Bacillus cereus group]MCU5221349.1 O-antigen ligase family protein [Bacillus tropicus]MDA1645525.1 O-antigen ligase family protein [Bacillus cereus group sp. TH163-1LC]MDA1794329.1 O-antigen ligase family protein [Bacillus cereus group sp. BY8-1LC]MDA1880470.1 O-antigen ligase family protein [Bacillus cereus group sp. BY10-2LC]